MGNNYTALDTVFHALADPTRRAVIQRLGQGPATVSELAEPFDMALPSFVKHIAVLEVSGSYWLQENRSYPHVHAKAQEAGCCRTVVW